MNQIEPAAPPIFIVGVPRSGTTLLAAMLSSHSRMSCGPESHFFDFLSPSQETDLSRSRGWPDVALEYATSIHHVGCPAHENYNITKQELAQYLHTAAPSVRSAAAAMPELYMRRMGKFRWVEKTPDHLPEVMRIRRHFPDAPIIRIVRDPRDVALSLLNVPWGPSTLVDALTLWLHYDLSSHRFFESDPLSITVRYEDLVASPEAELRRLCVFLRETYEPTMLDTTTASAHVNRTGEPWKSRIAKPADCSRVEAWRRELSEDDRRATEAYLGDRILAYGYPCTSTFSNSVAVLPQRSIIARYPNVLTALAQRGIKLWRSSHECTALFFLYLGWPDDAEWLRGGRVERALETIRIVVQVLESRLSRKRLVWLREPLSDSHPGYCTRLLSGVLPKKSIMPEELTTLSSASGELLPANGSLHQFALQR